MTAHEPTIARIMPITQPPPIPMKLPAIPPTNSEDPSNIKPSLMSEYSVSAEMRFVK